MGSRRTLLFSEWQFVSWGFASYLDDTSDLAVGVSSPVPGPWSRELKEVTADPG